MTFILSPSALARLQSVQKGRVLRIKVMSGGCSGFQYLFSLENGPEKEDFTHEEQGARIVIDPVSLPFLEGATLNFVEEMMGYHFEIINPNAASKCGCGNSFSPSL